MKSIITVLLSLTWALACNNAPSFNTNYGYSIFVQGDSNCEISKDINNNNIHVAWVDHLQLRNLCIVGQPVFPSTTLTSHYQHLTIFQYGANNHRLGMDPEAFRVDYQALLDQVPNEVICIAPTVQPFNDIIHSLCAEVIDAPPPDAIDGLHYTIETMDEFSQYMHTYLSEYPLP